MTTTNKIILAALVVTVMIIGVGYAVITDQTLTISGELKAIASQASFKIAFAGDGQVVSGSKGTVTATKLTDTTAKFSVEGLQAVGDTASATYTIKNSSTDLVANDLTVAITKGNSDYFEVTTTELSKTTLNPNEETTITVTTELIKTPITDQTQEVEISITATPGEAGEGPTLISFVINEHGTYYAEEGMTWEQWIDDSNYNVDGFFIDDGGARGKFISNEHYYGLFGGYPGSGSYVRPENKIEITDACKELFENKGCHFEFNYWD